MDFVMGFFVGVTFWEVFWVFVVLGLGMVSASYNLGLGFIVTFGIFLAGLQWIVNVDVLTLVYDNPFKLILLAAIYFLLGGVYSMFVSWPEFLRSKSQYIKTDYAAWKDTKKKYNKKADEDPYVPTIDDYLKSSDYQNRYSAYRNMPEIGAMITLWVFDALWKLISKPVKFAWKTTYRIFSTAFTKIGLKVSKNILEEKK